MVGTTSSVPLGLEHEDLWEWFDLPSNHGDEVAGGEAEIWPALAAAIPALISAAPSIVNAISSLVDRGRVQPAKPARQPTAPAGRPSPGPVQPTQASVAPVATIGQVAASQPRPVAAPPAPDVVSQLVAIVPTLLAALGRLGQPSEGAAEDDGNVDATPECSESPSELEPAPFADETWAESTRYTDLIPRPDPSAINVGVSPCPTAQLVARFGSPRDVLGEDCQAVTSSFWSSRMVTENVGPFRATGHRLAITLFRDAFSALRVAHPELYALVASRGMLCVRHVRGRPGVLSNHGLGMAIDIAIDGQLDVRGDDRVQRGLRIIHDVFSPFGIYWGAGFRTEDAMHFEVGADVVNRWIREGTL